MSWSCKWCDTTTDRVWEIPRKPDEHRSQQWVCKDCHTKYFDGELDGYGQDPEKADRVI